MSRRLLFLTVFAFLAAVSCVTINIYFPAEEVRGAADRIVNEVWGEKAEGDHPATKTPDHPAPGPGSSLWHGLGARDVFAAQDINVSTPEIRALKEAIKNRAGQLFPYLDSGHVGIGNDGMLKVRSTDGLLLKARGEVNRLIAAENADRQRLYAEIARANGFPDQTDEVRAIFAASWREQARPGWFLENTQGDWQRK
jgi:uncharacterized protein YdbL (DUF1318 family)